jgi:hypothetical protein
MKIVMLGHSHQNKFINHKSCNNKSFKDLSKEKKRQQLIIFKKNQVIHIKLEIMVQWVLQIN